MRPPGAILVPGESIIATGILLEPPLSQSQCICAHVHTLFDVFNLINLSLLVLVVSISLQVCRGSREQ